MNQIKIALGLCFLILFTSCLHVLWTDETKKGDGPIVKKTFSEFQFDKVKVNSDIHIDIYNAAENKVIVSAPNDIIDDITVIQEENNQITIQPKTNNNISTKKVRVEIHSPKLNALNASSSGSIKVLDSFITDRLDINTSSSAKIDIVSMKSLMLFIYSSSGSEVKANIKTKAITVQTTSGSELRLEGYSGNTKITASSGSKVNSKKLFTKSSDINASSGSRIKVSCTENATASASTGSHIEVYKKGKAFKFKKSESSGGGVELN